MLSAEPDHKKVGEEAARAFEQEYRETHPNGPYPPVEVKPKGSDASPSK